MIWVPEKVVRVVIVEDIIQKRFHELDGVRLTGVHVTRHKSRGVIPQFSDSVLLYFNAWVDDKLPVMT